jgi:hypothetical protein
LHLLHLALQAQVPVRLQPAVTRTNKPSDYTVMVDVCALAADVTPTCIYFSSCSKA